MVSWMISENGFAIENHATWVDSRPALDGIPITIFNIIAVARLDCLRIKSDKEIFAFDWTASKWKWMSLTMTDNELVSGLINCNVGNDFWGEDVAVAPLMFSYLCAVPLAQRDEQMQHKRLSNSLRRRLNVISQLIMFFSHAFTVSAVSESLADSQKFRLNYHTMPRQIKIEIFYAHYGAFCEMAFCCFFLFLTAASLVAALRWRSWEQTKTNFYHHTNAHAAPLTVNIKTRHYASDLMYSTSSSI